MSVIERADDVPVWEKGGRGMSYAELVKALRCCATMTCKGDECKYMILGCHFDYFSNSDSRRNHIDQV